MHNPAILELASSSFAAPHDLGLRDSGTNVGYISTGAVGAGIADIGVTGYGGGGGNSVTVTGRVGNVAGEFTLTKSGFSSEAASFVFGAAAFAGVGSNYYGEQHISSQPLTNYGDIVAYDANGNRNWFAPYYPVEQYSINNLSQYSSRTIYYTGGEQTTNAVYNFNGDLTNGLDGSQYTFDAQNRLLTATKSGVTMYFTYDGLNRQVSRKLGVNGTRTYSVWDGWDFVQEYQGAGTVVAAYLHGASGMVKNLVNNRYYYQDGSGSTSHLADSTGHLLWWFRYDLQGAPIVYNSADNQISDSGFDLHLFTGQQWYSQLGLYDLRNRFYSPDIGRFLQPDPIGFRGDRSNLYRYCRNNPVNRIDPSGLADIPLRLQNSESDWPGVVVNGGMWQSPTGDPARGLGPLDQLGGAPGEGPGRYEWTGEMVGDGQYVYNYNPVPRPPEDNQPSVEQPPPSNVPPQNPPLPSPPAAQPTNLPWIVVTIFNPSPFEPVSMIVAYPRARQVRNEANQLFPGIPNSRRRHQWTARTLTREVGPTTTRNLGILNEAWGFVWFDLRNLPARLSGQRAWAFQLQDLVDNEIGIWDALLGDE